MDALKLELNIALLPEHSLAKKLIGISSILAERHSTIVRLGPSNVRLSLAPHLTLFQTILTLEKIAEAHHILSSIATKQQIIRNLQATRYTYNQGEASFEVQREITDELVRLQQQVIEALNPLRDGLLMERDPAGNLLEPMLQEESQPGKNIRETGYGEVGGLFRPHDTTNWFELGTEVNLTEEPLPSLESLRGDYVAVGMFALGPQGTCPQQIAKYSLS